MWRGMRFGRGRRQLSDDAADRRARVRRRLAAVDDEVLALLLDESVPGRGQRLRALDLAGVDLRGELEDLELAAEGAPDGSGPVPRVLPATRGRSAEPVRHRGRTVR